MQTRDRILQLIEQNQRYQPNEPFRYTFSPSTDYEAVEKFKDTLVAIGGALFEIESLEEINHFIIHSFPRAKNTVIFLPGENEPRVSDQTESHEFANVGLAVLKGEFAVAENGAIWITDRNMLDRALPFICENLVLVINRKDVVQTLHEAYEKIEIADYQYGTLIAGPSKTADIEQSLVLGAHGPKTLTVLILKNAI